MPVGPAANLRSPFLTPATAGVAALSLVLAGCAGSSVTSASVADKPPGPTQIALVELPEGAGQSETTETSESASTNPIPDTTIEATVEVSRSEATQTIPPPAIREWPSSVPRRARLGDAPAQIHNVSVSALKTPSGNIECVMKRTQVTCEVAKFSFSPTPKPSWCDVDWVQTVTLMRTQAGIGDCRGDIGAVAAADVKRTLNYGQLSRVGNMKCLSQQAGLACWNASSSAGFVLSRSRFETFGARPLSTPSSPPDVPSAPEKPLTPGGPKADPSPDGCRIKGNISDSWEKIYHLPGQKHYNATKIDLRKGERWFCSIEEAEAEGWRPAKI